MNPTRFEAMVVNGQIQLPAGIELPESALVEVTVSTPVNLAVPRIVSPHLADPSQAVDFVMEMGESDAGI